MRGKEREREGKYYMQVERKREHEQKTEMSTGLLTEREQSICSLKCAQPRIVQSSFAFQG